MGEGTRARPGTEGAPLGGPEGDPGVRAPQRRRRGAPGADQAVEEVRCRRLIVVGPDGFERVVLDAGADFGSIDVRSARGPHLTLLADEQSAEPAAALHIDDGQALEPFLGVTPGVVYVEGFGVALEERVAELERMVERLVVELRQEVRTERLVVVDELDVERIATRVTATASTLQVIAPGERARARLEAVCGEAFEEPVGTRPRPAALAVVIAETDRDGSVMGDSAGLAAYSDMPAELEIHDHRDSARIGAAAIFGPDGVRLAPRATR